MAFGAITIPADKLQFRRDLETQRFIEAMRRRGRVAHLFPDELEHRIATAQRESRKTNDLRRGLPRERWPR